VIFVSAIHALRPCFAGREPVIAAAFGLLHGLAFATVLAEFGLGPWRMALCILGFNLGIELMQLAIVAVTVPWLNSNKGTKTLIGLAFLALLGIV
jgi:HupE/UreJ protein